MERGSEELSTQDLSFRSALGSVPPQRSAVKSTPRRVSFGKERSEELWLDAGSPSEERSVERSPSAERSKEHSAQGLSSNLEGSEEPSIGFDIGFE